MSTPTLINLPPPPSDPVTPSDMGPGTPNSGTTSLSALSTTAIKDGHQGHPHPYARHTHQSSSASATSTSTLEAERADRISRLAGLERIATARAGGGAGAGGGNQNLVSGTATSFAPTVTSGHFNQQSHILASNNSNYNNQQQGYFDSYPQQLIKERSTVGSASATGSIGGRTTWASGSDAFDHDKMSEDPDDDSSVGGDDVDDRMSDEGNASLVGFGEGANSTISGPISTISAPAGGGGGGGGTGLPGGPVRLQSSSSTSANPRPSTFGSSSPGNRNSGGFGTNNQYSGGMSQQQQQRMFSPSPAGSNTPEPFEDARMINGMTYDPDVVDTTVRTPRLVGGQNDQDEAGYNSPSGR